MDVGLFWNAIFKRNWLDLGLISGGPTLDLYGKNQYETHVGHFWAVVKKNEKMLKIQLQKELKIHKKNIKECFFF